MSRTSEKLPHLLIKRGRFGYEVRFHRDVENIEAFEWVLVVSLFAPPSVHGPQKVLRVHDADDVFLFTAIHWKARMSGRKTNLEHLLG